MNPAALSHSRRRFLRAGLALAGPLSGCGTLPLSGQQSAKVARIGFRAGSSAEGSASRLAALQQGLRELGYVEGIGFTIESRSVAVNLRTAQALGLTIPQSVLLQATEAIE